MSPETTSDALLHAFVQYVLPPMATAGGALLVWLLAHLVAWMKAKAASSKAAQVMLVFTELAQSIVADLEATLRPKVQAALSDGTLSAAEGAQLKAEAMRRLQQLAPQELQDAAAKLFGPLVGDWLSGLVERANTAQTAATTATVVTTSGATPS